MTSNMHAPFFSVLVLTVSCLLLTRAQEPVQPDFQQDQFVGNWFSIGFASNSQWFKEKKAVMKMCTTVVTPIEDGNLDVSSTYPKLETCETRKMTFVPAEEPGKFTSTNARRGSKHTITVVETNYSEYALLLAKKKDSENTMVTLYGRNKEVRPELLQKFIQLALAEGLTEDDILILPKTDQCMEQTV